MLTEEDKKIIEEPFNRALALRDQGDLQGAIQILSGIAESYPSFAGVFGVTGAIYKKIGDLENARKCFERTVELAPKSELASLNLFHTLHRLGNKARAYSEMNRFLSLRKSEEYDRLKMALQEEIDEYTRPSNNN